MHEEILALAKALSQPAEAELPLLEALCAAAEAELAGGLREGLAPEDCSDAFRCAAALLATAALLPGREAGEAVQFTAAGATKFLDTPLKDLRLKPGMLVAAIAREGKTIIPDGSTSIHAGDKVIVMAKSLFLQDLDEILQE